ncbi:MAG: methylase, partial [Dehalobacter sp.]|nr:methylase [Dehalobacter sp.]
VIVGFSWNEHNDKRIFLSDGSEKKVKRINPYLLDAPDVFVASRSKPLSNVSIMTKGSQPTDNGNFFFTEGQKQEFVKTYPEAFDLIRPFLGSKEYIQNIPRYCLWLKAISPIRYSKIPTIMNRIASIREFRLSSTKAATREDAKTPMLFQEIRQPDTEYILVPRVSSENRRYVPMGFIQPDVICGDQNLMIPDASLFEFGVITSSTHMAWMRTVAGRLEMRYRYSAQIVYNNFPWPNPTATQKEKIEQTAQAILDARELYPEASLADLYDELTMPPELRKAHTANDKAVWEAYGKPWPLGDEPACVAYLMRLYKKLGETVE